MRALFGLSTRQTPVPAGRTLAFITASQIDLVYRPTAPAAPMPALPLTPEQVERFAELRLLRAMERARQQEGK